MPRSAVLLAALLGLVGLAACDSPPAASSLPEWSATDHDRAEEAPRAMTAAQPRAAGPTKTAPQGPDPLLEATWAQQCAMCHGVVGRGDGPNGPMVHAADLTRADWQASVTDEQLASSIVTGKGKMPPFPDLPPKILAGIVARIRASRGR